MDNGNFNNAFTPKNTKGKKKLFDSKKVKYGTSAVVFTVVFVAVVLLINVVMSLVSSRTGGLYVDMTTENIYEAGEASMKAIDSLVHEVTITFASPKYKIERDENYNSVRILCEDFARKSDRVKIEYKDVKMENTYFNEFKKANPSKDVTQYSIVVHCKQTGYSQIFEDYLEMYKFSSTTGRIFAFNGEDKLVTAMLSVAGGEIYKVGFVTGHDEENSDVLKNFFLDNGYLVENVNLKSKTDEQLKEYKTVVICNPKRDFEGRSEGAKDSNNEIEKLRRYVKENFGNVILFADPDGYELKELFSLFSDDFGVKVDNGSRVLSEGENRGTDFLTFYSLYDSDTESTGYEIHKAVSEDSSAFAPLFGLSSSLEIVKKEADFYTVSPVLVTGNDAVKYQYITESNSSSVVEHIGKPLMTVTDYTDIIKGKEKHAYVFTVASTGFIDALENSSDTNADLMRSIFVKTGNANIVAGIDFKVVDDPTIQVSNDKAKNTQTKLVFVIPVIIAAIGIAVFVRRKRL